MLPKINVGTATHPRAAAATVAGWLTLAAAPTFAIMALVAAWQSSGHREMFHAAGHRGQLFGEMVQMYVLMSMFHCAPWLRAIGNYPARRRQRY